MRQRNQALPGQLALFGAYGRGVAYSAGEARLSRDAAIAAVGTHASKTWLRMAVKAVKYVAERREYLTTDSVWYVLEVRWRSEIVASPAERRAMGAVMREAQRLGYVELSGMTTLNSHIRRHVESIRATCHARPLTVWKSKIWNPRGQVPRGQASRGQVSKR